MPATMNNERSEYMIYHLRLTLNTNHLTLNT